MRRKLRQKEEWNLEYCISDCLPMSILCRAPLANESSLGEVKTHMDVRENCHFVQFATLSGVTFCKKYRKIQERAGRIHTKNDGLNMILFGKSANSDIYVPRRGGSGDTFCRQLQF